MYPLFFFGLTQKICILEIKGNKIFWETMNCGGVMEFLCGTISITVSLFYNSQIINPAGQGDGESQVVFVSQQRMYCAICSYINMLLIEKIKNVHDIGITASRNYGLTINFSDN